MSTDWIMRILMTSDDSSFVALAIKSTLVLLVALIAARMARRAAASTRHLVVAGSLGALLLIPAIAGMVPARAVEVSLGSEPQRVAAVAPQASADAGRGPAVTPEPQTPTVSLVEIVAGVYLTGVALQLLWIGAGMLRLWRVRRSAEVSVAGTSLANEMARREKITSGVEVLVSSSMAVPVTYGFQHPTILLPAAVDGWEEEELRRAIRHELEHVRRGDWVTQLVSRLACAFYWPHPLVWFAWQRQCLEAERACDDAVVRSFASPETYAEQLVSLARRLVGTRTVPALAMASRSNLGRRVEAILNPSAPRAPLTAIRFAAVALMAAGAVTVLAPMRLVAAAAPVMYERFPDDETDQDPFGVSLVNAAERGNVESIRRLLAAGANPNARIDGDGSPLIVAAREGHREAVAFLIESGADVNMGVPGDGNPLIMAAREGHEDIVKLLLDRGADIEAVVDGDENALIQAAGAGDVDVVGLLIVRGANVNSRVWVDRSDRDIVRQAGSDSVRDGVTGGVREGVEGGVEGAARGDASAGASRGGEWRTPLVMAKRRGNQEVVDLLIRAGAKE